MWKTSLFLTIDRCTMPLGAEDGRLVPGSFSASSYYNHHLAPWHGRLNHRWSWSVRHRRHGEWLQVSFGSSSTCKGVATQGRQDANQWVTRYTLSYSKDGMRFYPYNEGRGTVVMKKSLHILMGYCPSLFWQDILLDALACSIAVYVYQVYRILMTPEGESKHKQRVKIYGDTTYQKV